MIIKDLNKIFQTLDSRNMTVNIMEDEQGSIGGQKITKKDLTMRDVITNSLLAPSPQGQRDQMEGAEKARRYFWR